MDTFWHYQAIFWRRLGKESWDSLWSQIVSVLIWPIGGLGIYCLRHGDVLIKHAAEIEVLGWICLVGCAATIFFRLFSVGATIHAEQQAQIITIERTASLRISELSEQISRFDSGKAAAEEWERLGTRFRAIYPPVQARWYVGDGWSFFSGSANDTETMTLCGICGDMLARPRHWTNLVPPEIMAEHNLTDRWLNCAYTFSTNRDEKKSLTVHPHASLAAEWVVVQRELHDVGADSAALCDRIAAHERELYAGTPPPTSLSS